MSSMYLPQIRSLFLENTGNQEGRTVSPDGGLLSVRACGTAKGMCLEGKGHAGDMKFKRELEIEMSTVTTYM